MHPNLPNPTIEEVKTFLSHGDRELALAAAVVAIVGLSARVDYLERQLRGVELELKLRNESNIPRNP